MDTTVLMLFIIVVELLVIIIVGALIILTQARETKRSYELENRAEEMEAAVKEGKYNYDKYKNEDGLYSNKRD